MLFFTAGAVESSVKGATPAVAAAASATPSPETNTIQPSKMDTVSE